VSRLDEAIAEGMAQSVALYAHDALCRGAVPNFLLRVKGEPGSSLTVAWFVYLGDQSQLPGKLAELAEASRDGMQVELAKSGSTGHG
jgi:hypothetical protein